MPFPLIPTALGVSFLLVWAFIAGMVFRDGQIAARQERELDENLLPLVPQESAPGPEGAWHVKVGHRKSPVRAAS